MVIAGPPTSCSVGWPLRMLPADEPPGLYAARRSVPKNLFEPFVPRSEFELPRSADDSLENTIPASAFRARGYFDGLGCRDSNPNWLIQNQLSYH